MLRQQSQHSMITLIKFSLYAQLAIFMVSNCNVSEYTAYALLGGRETATVVRFLQLAVVYLRVSHHAAELHVLGRAYSIICICKP